MTDVRAFLRDYGGPPVRLMEVCGTHTAQIARCGIPGMLSPAIRLISGPGCPVCVTVTAYLDRLVALCMEPDTTVLTFGDLMRVRGSRRSLNDAKAAGGRVRMLYSPMDALKLARENPGRLYVFAAVGFETTAPVYAMLLERAESEGIGNLKLLTSLKTMPPVIEWICTNQGGVDGFLAPGHVSVITGSRIFKPLSDRFGLPFVVAGFEGEQILAAVYALVRLRGKKKVLNLYRSVVTERGNETAQQAVRRYFEPCGAAWRGMGIIPGSGMILRPEYARFDAGSAGLDEDRGFDARCLCAKVLTGAIAPTSCPMFGCECTPRTPRGACMISQEGSCYNYFVNGRGPQ